MHNKKVIIGGTFDFFHSGHRALLKRAFDLGEVSIGLVSEEMAKKIKARTVGSYDARKKDIEDFINEEIGKSARIFSIDDKFGPTLEEDFDYIVTSPETYQTAFEINKERQKFGKKQIEIVKIDYVLAEDGKPISSTRIYNGEIDKEGKLLNAQKL